MENEAKKHSYKLLAAIAAVAGVLLIGIVGTVMWLLKADSPSAFDGYMDTLFKEDIVENTINLHYTLAHPENYGITDYEISLGSFTTKDFEENYKELEEIRARLLKFNRKSLSKEQQLTYDILLDYVDTELSVKDLALYSEVLGPTTGYQAQLPVILAEYAFRTKRDIEDYLALLSKVKEMAGQIIEFEQDKAQAGLFMSDYAADAIIAQCEEFISEPEDNYMIDVFDDKIDAFAGLTQEEKEEYQKRNHDLITGDVVEAYQILIDGLKDLKGSGKNELGLCYYENGKEYYEYLLRSGTGSDVSVNKQKKRIEKYIRDYFQTVYDAMSENPHIYDEIMEYQFPDMEPEAILEDLLGKIGEDFPDPPQVEYTIKYVHPSMQENMSPAFYLTTPVDDIQNNLIYINQKHTGGDAESGTELYTTLAHEGYPGHLYQNAYTVSGNLPLIRNLFSFTGYAEGWATYVEFEYGYDFAGADETLADVLAGNEATLLALSAYIDIGIHYDGWDREDVAEYIAGFGTTDQDAIDEIFNYIVEEPGNYLSYFIGYLEFLDLRERAEEELGDAFDAKQFHDFVLRTGPAPFYIIEEYMEDWMTEQK
ncbi:DUF885 domain-containing protein [Parablautia muri]|uniref:DUF885 domain-containing protein n=1 Tax=Parablautia muri TaxID=2320879 RepID=A0A9X5BGC9_9FIRM|nr:DUF885 domain-containing protein [Parablautia muri]NBJ93194.1 DUF885 domain-containing protein [Parablautia muri]